MGYTEPGDGARFVEPFVKDWRLRVDSEAVGLIADASP